MKKIIFLLSLILFSLVASSQSKGYLPYDSAYFEKRGGNAEVIIENGTRNIPGFLYNKGNGRTEFRHALVQLDDTTYLVGADTLHVGLGGGAIHGTFGNLLYYAPDGSAFTLPVIYDSAVTFPALKMGLEINFPSGAGLFHDITSVVDDSRGSGWIITGTTNGQYTPYNVAVTADGGILDQFLNQSTASGGYNRHRIGTANFQQAVTIYSMGQNSGSGYWYQGLDDIGAFHGRYVVDYSGTGIQSYGSRTHIIQADTLGNWYKPTAALQSIDTTNEKVLVRNTTTGLVHESYWPSGGGGGARFGASGEDVAATANRHFSAAGHNFVVDSAAVLNLYAKISSTQYSGINYNNDGSWNFNASASASKFMYQYYDADGQWYSEIDNTATGGHISKVDVTTDYVKLQNDSSFKFSYVQVFHDQVVIQALDKLSLTSLAINMGENSATAKMSDITTPTTHDNSAVFEFESTSRGILPPRMTTAQRNAISSPATGLQIFCTDCTATDTSTGVSQSYNGATWKNYW